MLKVNLNKLVNLANGMEALFNPFSQYLLTQWISEYLSKTRVHPGSWNETFGIQFPCQKQSKYAKTAKGTEIFLWDKISLHIRVFQCTFWKIAYTLKFYKLNSGNLPLYFERSLPNAIYLNQLELILGNINPSIF